MTNTHIRIEQKLTNMTDREVENCLNRLERTFFSLSKSEKDFNSHYKFIHQVLNDLKKQNITTQERANSLRLFIQDLERNLIGEILLTINMVILTQEIIYWIVVQSEY